MHPFFAWDDRAAALAFVGDIAFAHVFAVTPEGPRVAHVPVLVVGDALHFHLANANAMTPHLGGGIALASVAGPNAYVSPNWYTAPATQVPTWNYTAVEVEGPVRAMTTDELVALLDATAAAHEPRVGEDWTRAKMAPPRFEAMCRAITGFVLAADAVRGTLKASQNKSDADARGIVAGQRAAGHGEAAAAIERTRS